MRVLTTRLKAVSHENEDTLKRVIALSATLKAGIENFKQKAAAAARPRVVHQQLIIKSFRRRQILSKSFVAMRIAFTSSSSKYFTFMASALDEQQKFFQNMYLSTFQLLRNIQSKLNLSKESVEWEDSNKSFSSHLNIQSVVSAQARSDARSKV